MKIIGLVVILVIIIAISIFYISYLYDYLKNSGTKLRFYNDPKANRENLWLFLFLLVYMICLLLVLLNK